MKWLSSLRTYLGHDELSAVSPDEGSSLEAARALADAQAALDLSRRRQEQFREVTTSLVDLNEKNHYGESIWLAMLPKEKRA